MTSAAGQNDQAEVYLDDAESALDRGDAESAMVLCTQALELSPEHPGAFFVRADALRVMGRLEEAADDYRRAALGRPDHASSWASLALTLFEMLNFEEARHAVARAIRQGPTNPEGWWVRSLLQEWRGDLSGASRSLAHARWLDPIAFPLPDRLTDEEVEDLVDQALKELHPTLRDYMSNVAIILEDVVTEDILLTYDPPASPLELLGYFSGHSLMERSTEDPWSLLPPTVVLFRRNLERQATNRDDLIHQLRITLFHEIGHFLGLDEDDLRVRGLD